MKKKIITAAIMIAALCGADAVSAAKPGKVRADRPCAEACTTQCGDSACLRQGPYDEIFAGLNLTPEQQQKLKDLKPAKPQARQSGERADRQRPDSAAMAKRRAERRQARQDYLNGVKSVLTPDQYVAFLEAVVVEQPGRPGSAPQARRFSKEGRRSDDHRMHARVDREGKKIKKADKAVMNVDKSKKADKSK